MGGANTVTLFTLSNCKIKSSLRTRPTRFFNRTVFRSVDVRPVFCFIPKIKLFSVFIWINTCDAYIVLSLIKDIYLISTVLLINQVSKNMTLINMYFASNGKIWRVSIAITTGTYASMITEITQPTISVQYA